MDYKDLSKEELINQLKIKNRFIEAYQEERKHSEDLQFAWIGNLGHWYWDVENNIVDFNPLKVTNLGYKPQEIPENIGFEYFTDKLDPNDYEQVMQNMRDHLYGKTKAYETEYYIKTKYGDWKCYYDHGVVTKRDEDGNPLFLAGIVFDITEQKNFEKSQKALINSLSEQLNLKEQLFSIIFHDLRSPMADLVGFSSLLQEAIDKGENEDIKTYSDIIFKSSQKTMEITDELMEFARAKETSSKYKHNIDLQHTVYRCIEEFRESADKKKLSIINQIPEETYIHTYEPILKIALRNFISNAIKFSHTGQNVEIKHSGNQIIITDHGTGIPREKLATLFTGKTHSAKGTAGETGNGIGLLLVKKLLENAGIDLEVDSELNKGTRVTMEVLPDISED